MYIPLLKVLDFYVSWALNQFVQVQFNVIIKALVNY